MIELVASAPQYRHHLEPLWAEIPPSLKGGGDAVLVASYRDLLAARRTGYRRVAYLEHGIGQSYGTGHPAYPGGGGPRGDVDLFLSPNATAAAADRTAWPRARVEVVGDPRLDTLQARQGGRGAVVAVSFHWDSRIAPETRSAMRHYAAALEELAGVFDVIGHAHPRARAAVAPLFTRRGIPFVADFDDVCRVADVYVCDNSSTLFEFAATGRPVVVLNDPKFRRNVHHGGRFWDWATIGIQVDDPAFLGDAIATALAELPEDVEAREAALNLVYQPRTNGAASAVTAILDWAQQAVAA